MDTSKNELSLKTLTSRLAKAEIFQSINFAVADTLVATTTIQDALPRVLRYVAEKINMDLAIFWFVNPAGNLVFHSAWNNPVCDFSSFLDFSKKTTFSVAQSLPGKIYATGNPFWTANFGENNYIRSSLAKENQLTSAIAFPVYSDLTIIGIIELFSLEPTEEPDTSLFDMLIYTGHRLGQFIKRRQLERKLTELQTRYNLITEGMDEAVVVANQAGQIIEWNASAEILFGWKRFQALGQPITIIMPEKYRSAHLEGLQRIRAADETYGSKTIGKVTDIEGLHKDGAVFPIETTLATWNADGDRYYSAVIKKVLGKES